MGEVLISFAGAGRCWAVAGGRSTGDLTIGTAISEIQWPSWTLIVLQMRGGPTSRIHPPIRRPFQLARSLVHDREALHHKLDKPPSLQGSRWSSSIAQALKPDLQ